jgi:hypothetical protein|nr:hypothetical protein [Acinetobacter bereziniae]
MNLNVALDRTALIIFSLLPCPPVLNARQRFPFSDQPYSATSLVFIPDSSMYKIYSSPYCCFHCGRNHWNTARPILQACL